jgi:nicotinate-nucleotide pyrophosphorylase
MILGVFTGITVYQSLNYIPCYVELETLAQAQLVLEFLVEYISLDKLRIKTKTHHNIS